MKSSTHGKFYEHYDKLDKTKINELADKLI